MTPYDAPKGYGVGNQANLPSQPTAGQKQPIKDGVGMGTQDACGSNDKFSGGSSNKVCYVHGRKSHQK